MRIGELAEKAGVTVRALRYYEEQGLLASERSSGGHRYYPDTGVDQVWLIQQFYAAGLSSKSILAILACVEAGETTPEALALLTAERDRIERQVDNLTRARDRLENVITAATAGPCASHNRLKRDECPPASSGVARTRLADGPDGGRGQETRGDSQRIS